MSTLGIGSKVWVRDLNNRVYIKDRSGPTERGFWVEREIVSESPRLWLVSGGGKIPKKGACPADIVCTAEDLELEIWAAEHQYRISQAVYRCSVEQLRLIAEIVGYEPKAPIGAV